MVEWLSNSMSWSSPISLAQMPSTSRLQGSDSHQVWAAMEIAQELEGNGHSDCTILYHCDASPLSVRILVA